MLFFDISITLAFHSFDRSYVAVLFDTEWVEEIYESG